MARSREEMLKAKREHMARRRANNPDAVRAYQRQHHHKNRDRNCEKMRVYYAKRFFWGRAMKLRGEGRAVAADLARLWKSQRGRCAMTGERLDREAQLDHIHPRCKGGDDSPANLQWVTAAVNYAKRDLSQDEFIALCGGVMRWIGERIDMVDKLFTEGA
jgi:CRISPR/Cas system Type II protein with McrA/HNH and RuvC-like nuclease domain